jgi:hypothetical protein
MDNINLPSLLAARTSTIVIPSEQLPELCALAKSIGATLCVVETGHRVSAGTDKNGRQKSRRYPTGYTVRVIYKMQEQERLPWD